MPAVTVVLSRSPQTCPERRAFEDAVGAALVEAGREVVVVPHIYYLAPPHPAAVRLAQIENGAILAAWLHPRAIEWTAYALGIGEEIITRCYDLGTFSSAEECVKAIAAGAGCADDPDPSAPVLGHVEDLAAPASQRWYPVLDYSRCAACRQCFGFCLFGVYSVEDDRVVATQPDNCKHGCPACARVCPQGAIIFPHCDDPAIAGAPGAEIARNPKAIQAVLERVRRKRAEALNAAPGEGDSRKRDDLDDLIDALEDLDD